MSVLDCHEWVKRAQSFVERLPERFAGEIETSVSFGNNILDAPGAAEAKASPVAPDQTGDERPQTRFYRQR
jgi:hypothetical protein